MKTKNSLQIAALSVLLMAGTSLTTMAQTAGVVTGVNNDIFVVNQDKSDNWAALRLQTSNNSAWNVFNEGGLKWGYTTSVDFGDMGTQLMFLTTDGKLGIGNISPAEKLDVYGNAQAFSFILTDGYIVGKFASNVADDGISYTEIASSGNIVLSPVQRLDPTQMPSDSWVGVGINKNNPSEMLDVAGNVKANKLILHNESTTGNPGTAMQIASNGTPTVNFGWNAGGYSEITNLFTNSHIVLTPNGTGNVGIGTTTPAAKLEVAGYAKAYGLTLDINGGQKTTPSIYISSNGTPLASIEATTGFTEIKSLGGTNSNILLSTKGTGNVGIGTTTPAQKLDVVGNINASGSITAASLSVPSLNITTGNVGIGTLTPTQKLEVAGGQINMIANSGQTWDNINLNHDGSAAMISAGGAESGLAFRINNVNSGTASTQTYAEAMRILPSGNVGIGTGAPTQKLDVAGSIIARDRVGISTTTPSEMLDVVGNAKANGFILHHEGTGNQASSMLITSNGTSVASFGYNAGGYTEIKSLYSNNHIVLTPAGTGNVGIGTATPTQKLDVAGKINSTGVTLNGGTFLINTNLASTFNGYDIASTGNLNPHYALGSNFQIYQGVPGSGSLKFLVDRNGNVGIGTATPTQLLDVAGNINASGNMESTGYYVTNAVGNGRGWDMKGGTATIGGITKNALLFNCDTTGVEQTKMLITGDGNVGIGTSTPDKGRLHVKGSFHVENSASQQVFHVSAGQQLVFVGADAYDKYNATLTNPASAIQTDAYTLWVSKGVVGEDFAIADVTDWDDYVFNEDYRLPSLKEVSTYIKANKHLPNVPSASEVKNGYTLHTMNRNFLKTIEELTLYAVDQEKKIDQLQAQLNQLAAEVEKMKASQR